MVAGVYGLGLTILLASSLTPLYLLHILTSIAGFQILKRRKWAAGLALFLFPLMLVFSISTVWYYLGGGINSNIATIALNLTLMLYAAFALISVFLISISWKEFK